MNRFIDALRTDDVFTENGMPTHSTSGSYVLDMFFKLGGARKMSSADKIRIFKLALADNTLLATKTLFYNRDIRGGQGERNTFRILFSWLCQFLPEIAVKNLENVPFYGRWDDLFSAFSTPVESAALDLIAYSLKHGDKLCAKWMPREGKKGFKPVGEKIRSHMNLGRKSYRRLLAGHTEVVESFMCANEWGAINYNHVPSVASKNYRNAFKKHDGNRYTEWLSSLEKEDSPNKIHADAIFPHSIVETYINNRLSYDPTLEAQWKALPDYVPDGASFIPVCDLSGSMNGLPMAVSASLGLYLSERNKGPFRDAFITFSRVPRLQVVTGKLNERIRAMNLEAIAENTNLEAVFAMILSKAKQAGLSNEDMPSCILIISDMQFDVCTGDMSLNSFSMMRNMYRTAGYKMPEVVFWNLRTSEGVPVKMHESGTALVSGFSPSIMKGLLGGLISPIKIMENTLCGERYSRVVV